MAGYFGGSKGDIEDKPQRGNRARLVPSFSTGDDRGWRREAKAPKGTRKPPRPKLSHRTRSQNPGPLWGTWDCFEQSNRQGRG